MCRGVIVALIWLLIRLHLVNATKMMCRNNGHTFGKWEAIDDPKEALSFNCPTGSDFVSTNKQDYLFHNGSRNFDWSGGCSCPLHKAAYWRWEPSDCTLLRWNATQFCQLLGPRVVLMTGDSTMNQAAATLMALIKDHGGQCFNQIYYGSSHFLIFQNQADFKWHNWILKHKEKILPDIVVLTVGAHAHDLGDMSMIWNQLEKDFVMFREKFFWHNMTYIWKTQQPGHTGCFNYSKPITTVNNAYRQGKHFHEDVYDWYLHPSFDSLSINQSLVNGVKILDMSPLYERPDAHPASAAAPNSTIKNDCLHYCIPGPIDLFATLFLQMLATGEV